MTVKRKLKEQKQLLKNLKQSLMSMTKQSNKRIQSKKGESEKQQN